MGNSVDSQFRRIIFVSVSYCGWLTLANKGQLNKLHRHFVGLTKWVNLDILGPGRSFQIYSVLMTEINSNIPSWSTVVESIRTDNGA